MGGDCEAGGWFIARIQDRFFKRFDYRPDLARILPDHGIGSWSSTVKNNQVLTGKIDSGQITHIDNKNLSTGDIVEVKIIDSTPFYLKAELI